MSDDKFDALLISRAAENAEKEVLDILKSAKMREKSYAYKSRVKPWEKLLSKVAIKKQDNPEYELSSVTDVLGLRVVTLFRQDMVEVVNTLLTLIENRDDLKPNPFIKNRIEEAIIFTPSIGSDPVISQIISKINSFEFTSNIEVKERSSAARYSSIHLVAYLDRDVPDYSDTNYKIPIEIQIRTVFEDAWGEIDHTYGYQGRTGKSNLKLNNPTLVENNLLTLKKFVDSCAEYADNIRDIAIGDVTSNEKIPALDTNPVILSNLEAAKIPENVIQDYMGIRQIRLEAESKGGAKDIYIRAAESFNSFNSQILNSNVLTSKKQRELFSYYTKMDEGLCRLTIGGREIPKAISIYEQLLKATGPYPVARFRLAQAYLSNNLFDQAKEQLKKCRQQIAKLVKTPESSRLVPFPDHERNRIEVGVFKMFGLVYWTEACSLYVEHNPEAKQQVLQLLLEACRQTKPGLEVESITPEQRISLINNLLFYTLEIVHLKKLARFTRKHQLTIMEYLSELAAATDIDTCENVSQLDTIMNAYVLQGNTREAVIVARRLEKISLQANIAGIRMDTDILERVLNILSVKRA